MRSKWIAPVCIAFMLIVTALLYNQLPAQVPIHWNINGQANQYADKAVGALLMPAVAIGIWLLMSVLPRFDPRREAYTKFAGVYQTMINLFLIFFAALDVIMLGSAAGWDIPVAKVVVIGIGLLFAFLGNQMGRIQPNWFVGIRTPWTLSDPEVWKQTHRLGGRTFFAAGILSALIGLLVPVPASFILFIVIVMAGTFAPVIYSYVLWQRLHHTPAQNS
jgi:uncharacterized membrane protein